MGRPLAWSDPSSEEFESSFGLCMETLKSVLGYSDADVYVDYSGVLINLIPKKVGTRRQGAFYGRKKHLKDKGNGHCCWIPKCTFLIMVLFSVKNILAKLPEDEIQAMVESPEVVYSLARHDPKAGTSLSGLKNDFTVRVDPDIEIEKIEGILAVWETETGFIESKLMTSSHGMTLEPCQVCRT